MPEWAAQLHDVWFTQLSEDQWFSPTDDIDAMLRDRFGALLDRQADRPATDFLSSPALAQAAILLFDQIPRNIHRGTPRAFATDRLAREITHGMIESGWLSGFSAHERQFILMPLMHSERLPDQDAAVQLFAEHAPAALEFARKHREMIARFGRFPHRNAVLGRDTTPAEQDAIDAGFAW